jgi:hypothetical protein
MNSLKAILKGIRSIFDLTGRTFSFPSFQKGVEGDREALKKDWMNVGDDLRKAMGMVAHGQN